MVSQDRDPRTDPRRGDLFSKPGRMKQSRVRYRQVTGVEGGAHVLFLEGHEGQIAKDGCVVISSWRRWAKGAEVLMRGEE